MMHIIELRILMFRSQGSYLNNRRMTQIFKSQEKNTWNDNEERTISAKFVTNILKLPLTCALSDDKHP